LCVLVALRWSTVDAGADAAGGADAVWLVVGLIAATAGWVAASCCQYGSTSAQLPVARLFAGQVAASFVGHVLPAGMGSVAVGARVLRRCGLSRSEVAAAVGLSTCAAAVVHVLAMVGLLLADPGFSHLSRGGLVAMVAAAAVVLAALWLAWSAAARRTPRAAAWLSGVVAHGRAALSAPSRSIWLWVGAVGQPALRIVVLAAATRSLGLATPVLTVALVYLGASAVSAVAPSPGGFGGLDVALLAAFTAVGATSRDAVAAIVLYRLVTVWILMAPGAAVFLVLLRRKAI
jgi:uncharacterized membrane protein YbhN (UPF0104 family)